MVMITIHIAYITCLVTNDDWHAYDVIGSIRYITGLVRSRISRNRQYCGWLGRLWARSRIVEFNGASNTVVGWDGYGLDRGP